jgi:hypothetical protein
MQRALIWITLLCCLAAAPVEAATGHVFKVLPQYLDLQGRASLSPSLYERDAYQATLRQQPAKCSGMQFHVQWKAKGEAATPLKLRIELRGVVEKGQPKHLLLEQEVKAGGWFSHWTVFTLKGDAYKDLGEVAAWRATLWEGDRLLWEQQSFLWEAAP